MRHGEHEFVIDPFRSGPDGIIELYILLSSTDLEDISSMGKESVGTIAGLRGLDGFRQS